MAKTNHISLMPRAVATLPLTILVLSLPLLLSASALGIPTGVEAPAFSVESGDGQKLTLADLAGRVSVILYETQNVTGQNETLKAELERLFNDTPLVRKNSSVYVVINCSSVVWPLTFIWKRKLVSHSVEEHLTIYGDWDSHMFTDYTMFDNKVNLVVLDKLQVVRYFHAGPMGSGEIEDVKNLLRALSTES